MREGGDTPRLVAPARVALESRPCWPLVAAATPWLLRANTVWWLLSTASSVHITESFIVTLNSKCSRQQLCTHRRVRENALGLVNAKTYCFQTVKESTERNVAHDACARVH